jgi:hypothetical protein
MIAIKRVALKEHHRRPGRTNHSFNGKEFGPFTSLEISQYPDDAGYYLMHICEDGGCADTWHESIDDALHQAEWEFGVRPGEWSETDEQF